MESERKKKLIALGAETLADGLLELAMYVMAADDMIDRLISSPKENIQRFKAKLADLELRQRFISWRATTAFARELKRLLEDLKSGMVEPLVGVELVAAFYQADDAIFDQCDDSSGNVGDVFRFDAKQLFFEYASQLRDEQRISEVLFELNRKDSYGVRGILVDGASEYLSEPVIRQFIKQCQVAASKETNEFQKRHWLMLVESLARQIKDAPLFEQARIASWGKLSSAGYMDIANVYLESDDPKKALSLMERIPADDTFKMDERDLLLREIHGKLGDRDKQTEVAWRLFRRRRSNTRLDDLLAVIGLGQKAVVIKDEEAKILKTGNLSYTDAKFLIQMGHMDAAETYLLNRADQLNGDYYYDLLPLSEVMETERRSLCASVLYRALLDSILRRAQTKTYDYGVRYLKTLDRLASSVLDWHKFSNHTAYMEHLRQKHGRKRSFWSRYEK